MTAHSSLAAPSWSAEATAAIDRLGPTHDLADRHALVEAVAALGAAPLRVPRALRLDRFLTRGASFNDRAQDFAAVATLVHLGVLDGEVVPPGWSPPSQPTKRLLAPLELALLRLVSLRSDVAAGQVALLEAGVSSAELAEVTAAQVCWEVTGLAAVELAGTARLAARRVTLPVWAWAPMQRLVIDDRDGALLYRGRSSDPSARQAAVLMGVHKTITAAGLGADARLAPESIRATVARRHYDAAPAGQQVAAAAAMLGIDQPERIAARIGVALDTSTRQPPAVFPAPHW